MRTTGDKENKQRKISPEKKRIRRILLVLYILSLFELILCRYIANYYSLDFSDNSPIYFYYGYPVFIILSFVLAVILNRMYGKHTFFRSATIVILILILTAPFVHIAYERYLNENIELYKSAIEYTLSQDNDKYFQEIELPERYDKIATGSPFSSIYIIKSEDATKIYFEKGGFYSSKGYLYVIPKEGKEKEAKRNYNMTYQVKKEMEGFWTWVSIEPEYLY